MKAMLRSLFLLSISFLALKDVSAQCNASFEYTSNGNAVSFTASATQGQVVHTWIFGDGTSLSGGLHNPVHHYSLPGVYNVVHAIRDTVSNCVDSMVKSVTVNFTIPCNSGFTASVNNNSASFQPVTTAPAFTHEWRFGDGTVSHELNPTHTYAQAGSYNVLHILSNSANNCWDSTSQVVTVGSNPSTCTATYGYSVNSNDSMTYVFTSLASGSSGILQYVWTVNGVQVGSGQSLTYTFPTSGNYSVCHKIISLDSCQATHCETLTINAGNGSPCNPAFTTTINQNLLQVVGVWGGPVSHTWYFGDGSIGYGTFSQHTYQHPGIYNVMHIVKDSVSGCNDTLVQSVNMAFSYACTPAFVYQASGVNPLQYNFISSSTTVGSSIQGYKWKVNGVQVSTDSAFTYTFQQGGNYNVCLQITTANGCVNEICKNINVQSPCNLSASYTYTFLNNGLPRLVQFQASPVNQTFIYKWTIPGYAPFYGPNPVYTFHAAGNYPVYLTVRDSLNNCFDSVHQNINITASPADSCQVDFTYTENPAQAGQFSFVVNSNQPVVSQFWVFFSNWDSTATQVMNPTHTFTDTGSYHACVTVVTNTGCTRSVCKTVNVTSTGRTTDAEVLSSYPNPVPGDGEVKVKLDLEEASKVTVNVYSTSGFIVYSSQLQGVRGSNVISVPVERLQKGQYFIDIRFGENRKRSVFQKL